MADSGTLETQPVPPCEEHSNAARPEDAPEGNRLARSLRTHLKQGGLGLVDQAIASATQFLTTVMIGRLCGREELGLFSMAFSFFVILLGVQNSFVVLPYTVYAHRREQSDRQSYAGSVLVYQVVMGMLAALAIGAIGLTLGLTPWLPGLEPVLRILALACPLLLLREFFRRLYVAHLRVVTAIVLDTTTFLLQLAGLASLAACGWLSATSSYIAMGASAVLATLACSLGQFRQMRFDPQQIGEDWNGHWRLGKWTFANTMAAVLQPYVIYWVLAISKGTAETGRFAACMSIIAVSNPFVLGISNILNPQASMAYARSGIAGLRQVVAWATYLFASGMGILCTALALGGAILVPALYGSQFGGQGITIALLAMGILARAVGIGSDIGLLTLEHSKTGFVTGAVGLLLTVVSSVLFVVRWGATGCAAAFLLGSIVATALRFWAFHRLSRTATIPADFVASSPQGGA